MFRNVRQKDVQEETITVVFHAILSEKFGKLDDGTKIVIRGQGPIFEGWDKGGVALVTVR